VTPALTLLLALAATDAPPCTVMVLAEAGLESESPYCLPGHLAVDDRLRLAPGGFVQLALPSGDTLTCVQGDGASAWARVATDGPVVDDGADWTCRRSALPVEAAGDEAPAPAPATPRAVSIDTTRNTADAEAEAEPAPPSADDARLPLLVVQLDALLAPDTASGILDSVIVAHLEREPRLKIADTGALKELLARASELAAVDEQCTDASDSCVLSVAGALGSRYVLGGSVAADDRLLQVQLVLLDSEARSALARVDFRAANIVAAGDVMPDALHNVLRPLLGGEELSLPAPPPNRRIDASETITGAAIAGGTASAGLGLSVAPIACGAAVCGASSGVVGIGAGALLCSIAAPCYAPPLALAGAVGGAALGDHLTGFDIGATKALLLGAAGGGAALSLSLATVGALVGSTFIAFAATAAATDSLDVAGPAGTVAGIAAAVVITAVLALALAGGISLGTCFAFLTPLLEPTPDPLGEHDGDWWAAREQAPPTHRLAAHRTQRF
jgi:TolB-like protein